MITIKLTYSHSMLSADGASEVRMLRTKDAPVVDGLSPKPPRWGGMSDAALDQDFNR
jgi:hypothetical protein